MNYKYLLAAGILSVGAGCLALTKQHKTPQPDVQVHRARAANAMSLMVHPTNLTVNITTGRAGAQASYIALAHSEQIAKQGQKALDQKRYPEAETLFRKAVAIQPENSAARLLLAEVCERQGKLEEALEAYHALVYAPDAMGDSIALDPTTRMRYVLALVRSNRYTEAVAVYDLARKQAVSAREESLLPLRFDANNPDENRLQAAAHYVMGVKRPEHRENTLGELRQHLEAAIRLAPDWGKPYAELGKMLERRNHFVEAEGYYTKARNLGEPVESYKQESERIFARMRREHDLAHPEIHQSDGVMIPIKLNNAQIKELIAKSQAEVLRNTQQLEAAKAAKKAKEGAKATIQGATIPGQPKL